MREREYLISRYKIIISGIGIILCLSGALMLIPLALLPGNPREWETAWYFLVTASAQVFFGFILWRFFRPARSVALSVQEGGIIVLIGWIAVILFSAIPFLSLEGIDYSRGVFESVSAWTTTGLSVIDVTRASRMILFWRSLVQLAGGAGLAIIMMSALTGPSGTGIPNAEGRGDQLVPQVSRSARLVLLIYLSYAAAGTLAYWAAGMSFFDAINHCFAAISTGGFSTRVESIGYWDSAAIEAVTIPLMILGNLSFVTAWYLWRGRMREVARNGEVRVMTAVIPIATAAVFFFTSRGLYLQLGKAARVAVFEVVSAITTTGYSTVPYTNWNSFGILILIVLMLIGGGTCSTAGGIKQFRIYLMWKYFAWEAKRPLMPRTAVVKHYTWEGNRKAFLDDTKIRPVFLFILLYMTCYFLGVTVLCASGYSLSDSLFEFASALGTVGLSVGVTSARMHNSALWAEIIAMFMGRLEFFVVIVSLVKLVQDTRRMIIPTRILSKNTY